MACSVVVTHLDLSTLTYTNYLAGISANDGTGWKLCLIPDLSVGGGPTQPLIVPLLTGDTYKTTGALPSQSLYPGYNNLISSGVPAANKALAVLFTAPVAPVTDAPFSASSVVITHADASQDTYPNTMAGISVHDGKNWQLSVLPNQFKTKSGDAYQKPFIVTLRNGDNYRTTGTLPPTWSLMANSQGSSQTVLNTALPVGTVNTPPTVTTRA